MASDPTVFLVDDDEAVRDSLAAVLESEGLDVETFDSGEAFLAAFDLSHPGCLLVDVRMPGISGLELHETLVARGARIPVIMITGQGDVPTAVRAMKAGVGDFIEKPVDPNQIVGMVRDLLAKQRGAMEADSAAADVADRIERLTPRERDVLKHLVAGAPNKVIAYKLGISPRTVEVHRARVMDKMQARHLSELVRMALAVGLFDGTP
jgi:two-component system response regulator FixJ